MDQKKNKLTFIIILIMGFNTFSQHQTKLVYECNFNSETDLEDWKMEGPGIAKVEQGKLLLYSKYFGIVEQFYKENGGSFTGSNSEFYGSVEAGMKEVVPNINDYYYDGIFRGGHLVYWNTFLTPDNYIIECDFQSLSSNALHMLMFSCLGKEDQNVFDSSLRKRNGVAAQYTKGDLKNYRISFFAPGRGTSNMRKCPGRILTAKGDDLTLQNPNVVHHLKIVKCNNIVDWFINGELCFRFTDDENNFLKGGTTAIRLMVPAKGLYDNYKIYEILD